MLTSRTPISWPAACSAAFVITRWPVRNSSEWRP